MQFRIRRRGFQSRLSGSLGRPAAAAPWLLEMLFRPVNLTLDPTSELGFTWLEDWNGQATVLPVDGLQISAHLAPAVVGLHSFSGQSRSKVEGGEIMPRTLNRQAR